MKTRTDSPQLPIVRRYPRTSLFFAALALRFLTLLAVSWRSKIGTTNLSLCYDGHLYILLAKTFPRLYGDVHAFFPEFPFGADFLTAYFPLYSFLIALARFVFRDFRLTALAVSQCAASLAVVLFYDLARRTTRRPLTAAALFLFLPPVWLLCGSLAFVEPVYCCLFIAAMLCHLSGRRVWAFIFAGLALVTQKSGFIILPILLLTDAELRRGSKLKALMPYGLALLPAALMQARLWSLYGDALINIRTQRAVYGGVFFQWPGTAFISHLLAPYQPYGGTPVLRKAMIVASLLFYGGALALSWPRRTTRTLPLIVWLAIVLAFNLSLSAGFAFYGFPRFMLVAAPPAILLWLENAGRLSGKARLLLMLVPAVIAFDAAEAGNQIGAWARYWVPPYSDLFVQALRTNPDHVETTLGMYLVGQGKSDEGIAHLREALRIAPGCAPCHANLANALVAKKQYQEALAHFQEALRLDPGDVDSNIALGNLFASMGRPQDALRSYLTVSWNVAGLPATVYFKAGVIISQTGHPAEAERYFREAVRIDPRFAEAHHGLCYALFAQNRLAEAAHSCEEAIRIRPDFALARKNLSMIKAAASGGLR